MPELDPLLDPAPLLEPAPELDEPLLPPDVEPCKPPLLEPLGPTPSVFGVDVEPQPASAITAAASVAALPTRNDLLVT
jgi:hypothetical protein